MTVPTGKLSLASVGTDITEVPVPDVISRVAYLWVVELKVTLEETVRYSSGKKVFDGRVTEAEASNPTLPDTAVLPERLAEDIVGLEDSATDPEPVVPLLRLLAAI
jgi:hypothetical protein